VTIRLRQLPVGRAWEALREDEIACRSLGINTTNTKLTAFAMGAMFAGFAGSFFAARQGFISPESFTFLESATILSIVVLGGMGSMIGVAVAAVAMIGGTEIMRELDFLKIIFGNDFDPTQYRMLIFGFAMVLIMIWKPRGLVGTREPSAFLKERPHYSRLLRQGRSRMSAKSPVLRVEHVTMRFGGLVAVDDLSFSAARGDITALIGPNGAGKTTVFNCITGFYKPTEGRIALAHGDGAIWDEIDTLTDRGTRSLRRGGEALFLLERMPDYLVTQQARVARTFQNIRLFTGMTVFENMLVAQHNTLMVSSGYTLIGVLAPHVYGRAEKVAVEKARYWLEKTNLLDRADDPAGDLPYGAQRRLEIARAMCTDPVLLCLDEPAAGLNPRESHELNELLLSIRQEHATSILLIEHDMSVVMQISDHVVVLDYGVKISDGTPEAVRNDQKVVAAYLGVEDEEVAKGRGGGRAVTNPLLAVRGVKTYYGKIVALKGVDVDVADGEIVTLIGANGAGKSTLMMTIFGNPRAREGSIVFDGRDITRLPDPRDRAAAHRAGAGGPPHLLAHDGAGKPADGRGRRGRRRFRADCQKVFKLFPRSKQRLHQRGGTLSGGEQQMLAIARAPDGAPAPAAARRALARPCPDDRAADLRCDPRAQPRPRSSPCSWWSRTPSMRSSSRTAAT
jgi:ABC-type branched-subunit amino acid transport system ATPase component